MATLYVTEFGKFGFDENGGSIPLGREPAFATQAVTITSSSTAATNAFGKTTFIVRLLADANCHVKFGANPTATTNDELLLANVPEWRFVEAGHKVAVIEASS